MTEQDANGTETRAMRPNPSRRVLVAMIAGLIAVVIALSGIVFDLGRARLEQDALLEENRRAINALTKQLYWAETQLDELREQLDR